LRLFSFGDYGLALAALALVVFGAYDSYPILVPRRKEDSRYSPTGLSPPPFPFNETTSCVENRDCNVSGSKSDKN